MRIHNCIAESKLNWNDTRTALMELEIKAIQMNCAIRRIALHIFMGFHSEYSIMIECRSGVVALKCTKYSVLLGRILPTKLYSDWCELWLANNLNLNFLLSNFYDAVVLHKYAKILNVIRSGEIRWNYMLAPCGRPTSTRFYRLYSIYLLFCVFQTSILRAMPRMSICLIKISG